MLPSLRCRVLSVSKTQWVRVVLSCDNLHPQVCPIEFFSAPRVGRDDGDDDFDTNINTEKTVTTVTIVTLRKATSV
ncbi:MAG: hypothetical protein PWQ08_138 [Clostridiales bacterium]|nr:hypothetical protein [Clostridiales bacterium]